MTLHVGMLLVLLMRDRAPKAGLTAFIVAVVSCGGLGGAPQVPAGGGESPVSAAGPCSGKDGIEWFDCCVSRRSDPDCGTRLLSSQIRLTCESGSDQPCLSQFVGDWTCPHPSGPEPISVHISASGLINRTWRDTWDKGCLTCDGSYSGIVLNQQNFVRIGHFTVDTDPSKASDQISWCGSRESNACRQSAEGSMAFLCSKTAK